MPGASKLLPGQLSPRLDETVDYKGSNSLGARIRARAEDANLVQLGCAVVGVQVKDLVQHLEKLTSRSLSNNLRYDHFFTGSGVPLCEEDLRVGLADDEIQLVERALYELLEERSAPSGSRLEGLDGARLQLVDSAVKLQLCTRALISSMFNHIQSAAGADVPQSDSMACDQLDEMLHLLQLSSYQATPLLLLVILKYSQLRSTLVQLLLLPTSIYQLVPQAHLAMQVLHLIQRLAQKADTCRLLLEPVAAGTGCTSVAAALQSAACKAEAQLEELQEADAADCNESDVWVLQLATAIIETYHHLKAAGAQQQQQQEASAAAPPVDGTSTSIQHQQQLATAINYTDPAPVPLVDLGHKMQRMQLQEAGSSALPFSSIAQLCGQDSVMAMDRYPAYSQDLEGFTIDTAMDERMVGEEEEQQQTAAPQWHQQHRTATVRPTGIHLSPLRPSFDHPTSSPLQQHPYFTAVHPMMQYPASPAAETSPSATDASPQPSPADADLPTLRPIVTIPSTTAEDPYMQSWGTPTSSVASPLLRTPADERRQMNTQLLRNLQASVEADPSSGNATGYWGSPLNSGRAERAEHSGSPFARTPGENGRHGGSQLSRNTRAAELVEESDESSTWGSPATTGHSSSATPGSNPRAAESAYSTPGRCTVVDTRSEIIAGTLTVQPRSLLAAALEQARCPARRALAFGEDDAPGTPPAEASEPMNDPPPVAAAAAAALAPAISQDPADPMLVAASYGSLSMPVNLLLPASALQPATVAEMMSPSPVASPHHDQRNTRDQVGPSSNTRRSQTNIPDPLGAAGTTALPSNLRPVDTRAAAIPEHSYMETWGSPRSDDMSAFEPGPLHNPSTSSRPLLPNSNLSAASLHQARLARWLPASSPSPLSRMTMQGSRSPADERDQSSRRSGDDEDGLLVSPVLPTEAIVAMFSDSSPSVCARLTAACTDFPRMRQVAGDGNCFYRALLFAILEHIVSGPSLQLHQRVILRLEQLWLQLWQMLTPDDVTCQGRENLMGLLRRMWFLETARDNPMDMVAMEAFLQDRRNSDPIIKFLRMITSFELQNNAEYYAPFLAGCYDSLHMLQICEAYVEPLEQDAEQLQMVALIRALDVCVGILDVGGSELHYIKHPSSAAAPSVWLVHTPGHYSIVYPKESFNVREGYLCTC